VGLSQRSLSICRYNAWAYSGLPYLLVWCRMALLTGTGIAHICFNTPHPSSVGLPFERSSHLLAFPLISPERTKYLVERSRSWRGGVLNRRSSSCVACLPSPPPRKKKIAPKLYVSGLSYYTTEQGLRNAFSSFGNLVEATIAMDRVSKRSRGFAFLRYASEEEAEAAIKGMHGKFLDGRVIFVEYSKLPSELRGAPPKSPGPPYLR